MIQDDQFLLDREIGRFTMYGWQIITRSESAVQLRKKKEWSHLLLFLGFFGLLALGGGIFFLALAVFDYLIKKDIVIYLTVDHIRAGQVPDPHLRTSITFVAIVLSLFVIMLLCVGFFFLAALL